MTNVKCYLELFLIVTNVTDIRGLKCKGRIAKELQKVGRWFPENFRLVSGKFRIFPGIGTLDSVDIGACMGVNIREKFAKMW